MLLTGDYHDLPRAQLEHAAAYLSLDFKLVDHQAQQYPLPPSHPIFQFAQWMYRMSVAPNTSPFPGLYDGLLLIQSLLPDAGEQASDGL